MNLHLKLGFKILSVSTFYANLKKKKTGFGGNQEQEKSALWSRKEGVSPHTDLTFMVEILLQ